MQINTNYNYSLNFKGKHLDTEFSTIMNAIRRNIFGQTIKSPGKLVKIGDVFESNDVIQISTTLKNGENVVAVVNFESDGKVNFVLNKDSKENRKMFKEKIKEKYTEAITKGSTRRKLGIEPKTRVKRKHRMEKNVRPKSVEEFRSMLKEIS